MMILILVIPSFGDTIVWRHHRLVTSSFGDPQNKYHPGLTEFYD
ncbi:hypothetical protein [Litoribrevibacter albus]|nr:hypothetical protein [Litoribrevibacter albus]